MFVGEERRERPVAKLIWVDAHGTLSSPNDLGAAGRRRSTNELKENS
jgi:hypothetical protein